MNLSPFLICNQLKLISIFGIQMDFPKDCNSDSICKYIQSLPDIPTERQTILAIPEGTAVYAWITSNNQVTIKTQFDGNLTVHSLTNTSYSTIPENTLFRATLTTIHNILFCCIDDILLFRGTNCQSKHFGEKLCILTHLVDQFTLPLKPSPIHFCLPLMADCKLDIEQTIYRNACLYPIKELRIRFKDKFRAKSEVGVIWNQTNLQTFIIQASASPQPDAFDLISIPTKEKIGLALIPDIQTSNFVKMALGITHSSRLDDLEESSSDEEEEKKEKQHKTQKQPVYVLCQRHSRLNKWVPIKCV